MPLGCLPLSSLPCQVVNQFCDFHAREMQNIAFKYACVGGKFQQHGIIVPVVNTTLCFANAVAGQIRVYQVSRQTLHEM